MKLSHLAVLVTTLVGIVGCAAPVAGTAARQNSGQDFILTATKPDRLFVIDARARTVKSEFRIPGANNLVSTIVPSPDGRIAYVLVNKMESIVGMDLETGQAVFRADFSTPGERVRSIMSFDVTPDGREIIVHQLPVRVELNEYKVQEPRFAVYRTDAGLQAKPVRTFPAPRRVHMVLSRKDGRSFYAMGFDLYEYDRQTGKLIAQQGIRDWQRPDYSLPDLLALWPVTEPTGIFSSPVFGVVTPPGGPEDGVAKTALMTLDTASGKLEYHDFEETTAVIFSTVMSPSRPEAFGVYTQLSKIDTANHTLAKRIDLPHTFYSINISSDGSEIYIGGAMCDVAIHDAATLDPKANIRLPGCGDQSLATLRVVRR
ncbi:MAG TPA: quinohemoprotein amine dehydrogenase subunit beta [Steroidobacter sp.]|uniref:quinohemoprotein amine dehydrogenase subunit beta n=1 Tax=Steroidobacter sp. TaxID=1978227 RepID=UPI002ED940E0